jgi:REP element-mobilizing transposase RayT
MTNRPVDKQAPGEGGRPRISGSIQPGYAEVEAFLNEQGASRPVRREHHLGPEVYAGTGAQFFLTLCARHHQEPFRNPDLADAVLQALRHRRDRGVCRVYAYCLMPDHLHAVLELSLGNEGLLHFLDRYKSWTTQASWKYGLHGKLWQHDQYDRLLRDAEEFETRCRYVLNNPVRKGWVEDWSDWPHSGIMDEW